MKIIIYIDEELAEEVSDEIFFLNDGGFPVSEALNNFKGAWAEAYEIAKNKADEAS